MLENPKPRNAAYGGKQYTPIFHDLPEGMSLIDIAVYGEIVRRSGWEEDGKFTASAQTVAKILHLDEQAIDKSFQRLVEWNVITCTFRGRATRTPSHYVPNDASEWNVPEKVKQVRKKKNHSLAYEIPQTSLSESPTSLSDSFTSLSEPHHKILRDIDKSINEKEQILEKDETVGLEKNELEESPIPVQEVIFSETERSSTVEDQAIPVKNLFGADLEKTGAPCIQGEVTVEMATAMQNDKRPAKEVVWFMYERFPGDARTKLEYLQEFFLNADGRYLDEMAGIYLLRSWATR